MTTTPTPTSGAADLLTLIEAYAEARHLQGHSSYNAQTAAAMQAVKDALAAGQATAAPAEPDPTLGDHPPPCGSELFESGVSVGLFDIPKWTAEALCKGIAAATGARVDWHYIGGRVHVKALPAPTSAEGVAYAALPDERAAFEAQFPVPGGVHWDGTEYVVKDSHVTSYRCNRFEGQWEAWKARASHGPAPAGAGEAAEHYRNAIARACEGWTMPDGLRKHLETALWSPPTPQPTQPQASAVPLTGEYPALVCDYCGALTPDPWHSSGMLHGKMSKHIHSCDACAAPPTVARKQLTPERVKEIVRGAGYDQCGIPDTERAAFINGLRHGEQAHGIKGGQHVS